MSSEISENLILKYAKVPRKVAVFGEVYSTNDTIKDLDVDCVVAKSQTGGRGTNNRKFFSPKGGVYLSFKLINPKISADKLHLVTPYFAVITAKAIEKLAGIKPQIKWVNDIYLNGKKVAGILTESKIYGDKVDRIIVGIGINVKRQNFPDFILNKPTSIEGETGVQIDENRLIAELLNGINDISSIENEDFIGYYKDRFYLINKKIKITLSGVLYEGIVKGVDKNLSLILDIGGETKTFICHDQLEMI